jgi:hypothetical protein
MNAKIQRTSGETVDVEASWDSVSDGNMQKLVASVELKPAFAMQLFSGSEQFTLTMNDGRSARVFITHCPISSSSTTVWADLACARMIKGTPD